MKKGGGGSVQSLYTMQSGRQMALWLQLKRFFKIASAFFMGNARWRARSLLGLMLVLCGISTGLFVVISYTQRDLSTALSKKDQEGFYLAVAKFGGIVVVAAPLFAIYDYTQGLLAMEWRKWLTELLIARYFANRAFFDIKMDGQLDNPDQRICEDVASFVDSTVAIVVVIAGKLLNVTAFSGVLWSISPGLVFFLLGYSVFGTYAALRLFGRKLMWLRFEGLQREADLRYSLVRVRDNAEAIAFYRGEGREASSVRGFLGFLILNIQDRLVWERHLSLFNNFYEYATIVIPSLIIAPQYFAGKVEFGVIAQTGFAFRTILAAMTLIVSRFSQLSGLAAESERLDSLLSALGQRSKGIGDISFPLATSSALGSKPALLPSKRGVELVPRDSADLAAPEDGGEEAPLLRTASLKDGRWRQNAAPGTETPDVFETLGDSETLSSEAPGSLSKRQLPRPPKLWEGVLPQNPALLSPISRVGMNRLSRTLSSSPTPSPSSPARALLSPGLPPGGSGGFTPLSDGPAGDATAGSTEADHGGRGQGSPDTSGGLQVSVETLPPLAQGRISREESDSDLVLDSVTITTPNLRLVLFPEGLSLAVAPGESLLVMGPSGCGKSSLLRAIAGLWNLGKGKIRAPPLESTFFLPQKPYMPQGSLRDQLLFPLDLSQPGSAPFPGDDALEAALNDVALGSLTERVGGLGAQADWSDTLSTGEQQRVAFARLLLHRPNLAFLDEATSALDSANEARLYSLLRASGASYVSVGHRSSLIKFHSQVLSFDEDRGWGLTRSED